jgi:hypothetical protein
VTFSFNWNSENCHNAVMKNSPPIHLAREAREQKAKDIEWANFVTEKLDSEQLIAYCKEHGFETEGRTEQEIRLTLLQSRY